MAAITWPMSIRVLVATDGYLRIQGPAGPSFIGAALWVDAGSSRRVTSKRKKHRGGTRSVDPLVPQYGAERTGAVTCTDAAQQAQLEGELQVAGVWRRGRREHDSAPEP
ncbi:hypothetical protein AERO8C_50299 [Aeromonas veronii]|uniref:Uncharacterized protein n=1 Tax=Aeromonas veronii TaxID=654 RepID=A0A653LA58_AERVE|nr:hypothetical protein AERO8C_50299 [Aeromonas veronii]